MEDSLDTIRLKCRVSDFVTERDQEFKNEQDEDDDKNLPSESLSIAEESNRQSNKVQDKIIQDHKDEEIQTDKNQSNNNSPHHDSAKNALNSSNRESKAENG